MLTRLSRATKLAMKSSDVMAHERLRRFRRHAVELHRYIRNNSRGLINYGLARRKGQRISTAPAESGMGHLVKERMGRGKPIRWSADGANLLLQVRCAVLDARLDKLFREWYPRFQRTPWTVGLRGRGRVPLGRLRDVPSHARGVHRNLPRVTVVGTWNKLGGADTSSQQFCPKLGVTCSDARARPHRPRRHEYAHA